MSELNSTVPDHKPPLPQALKGRGERFDQQNRRILIYQCKNCGYTVEHVQLPADYSCPLCDARRQQFRPIDPDDFPAEYINERWPE
ncbi:hypothetical protein HCH52_11930 [Oscillospiraceae bacterium HV4-5-C5C]|nr:hypothetical protein [Oscillospiraceae bacterium HV4-5-C5C]